MLNNPIRYIDPSGHIPLSTGGTLQIGSSGKQVTQLQTALRNSGYNISVDGKFGPQTQAAVNAFKNSHGLSNSGSYAGVVGGTTWGALTSGKGGSNSSKKTSSSSTYQGTGKTGTAPPAPVKPNASQGGSSLSGNISKVGNVTTIAEGASKGFELADAAKTFGKANTALNIAQTVADGYEQTQKNQPVWKGVAKVAGHFVINAGTGLIVGSLAVVHGAAYVGSFGPEAPLTYPVITVSGTTSIYYTIKVGDMVQSQFDEWIDSP